MAVPKPPTVILFTPFESFARLCCNPYIEPEQHSDTRYEVAVAAPYSLVSSGELAAAETQVTVTGLALDPGTIYAARVAYRNIDGWSAWSANEQSRVPRGLSYTPLPVGSEPAPSIVPLTHRPSFSAEVESDRALHEQLMMSGDVWRRLQHIRHRPQVQLRWGPLTGSDRDDLVGYLRARLDAVEAFRPAFSPPDPVLGNTRAWFVLRGTITSERVGPTWLVTVSAIEAFG